MMIMVIGIAIEMAKINVMIKEPQIIAHALLMNSIGLEDSSLAFFSLFIVLKDSYEGGLSKDKIY